MRPDRAERFGPGQIAVLVVMHAAVVKVAEEDSIARCSPAR